MDDSVDAGSGAAAAGHARSGESVECGCGDAVADGGSCWCGRVGTVVLWGVEMEGKRAMMNDYDFFFFRFKGEEWERGGGGKKS